MIYKKLTVMASCIEKNTCPSFSGSASLTHFYILHRSALNRILAQTLSIAIPLFNEDTFQFTFHDRFIRMRSKSKKGAHSYVRLAIVRYGGQNCATEAEGEY